MDFKDAIRQVGERAGKLIDQIQTEEATKTALILPFIQTLGYDVFDPAEVVPEFIADIGIKKGEKVDYAIFRNKEPKILIECKHWKQNLDFHDGQLLRYFHVTKAKFAILTNGLVYRFYTDLFESNKMDEKPFLEFDITKITDAQIEELKKFHKSYFDEAVITHAANELLHTNALKQLISNELKNPGEEFIRFFAQKAYPGRLTQSVIAWLSDLVRRSVQQVVSDIITERLTLAINQENLKSKEEQPQVTEPSAQQTDTLNGEPKIDTTEIEVEGFYIVKSICRQVVDAERIVYRDTQTYFSILLDDNNRKPICRLYLNKGKKYLATFDETKKEVKREIQNLDHIYAYSADLVKSVQGYEKGLGAN